MSNSQAGPPPFTITCDPPPSYEKVRLSPKLSTSHFSHHQPSPPSAPVFDPHQSTGLYAESHHHLSGFSTSYPDQQHQERPAATIPVVAVQVPQPIRNQPVANNPTTVVHVQTEQLNLPPIVGLLPNIAVPLTCPSCHEYVLTTVRYKVSGRTHAWAACLFLFLMWPCCLCPYCIKSCKSAHHFCPKCGRFIGRCH